MNYLNKIKEKILNNIDLTILILRVFYYVSLSFAVLIGFVIFITMGAGHNPNGNTKLYFWILLLFAITFKVIIIYLRRLKISNRSFKSKY